MQALKNGNSFEALLPKCDEYAHSSLVCELACL